MIRRRLAPLLSSPTPPSVKRRVIALTVLGVGLPVLFLAGLGLLQTSGVARFLRETTVEYGHYAGLLVSNALETEIGRRANDVAERARLAATWGGASPDFLPLLASNDPLFSQPFITPVEAVRAHMGEVFATPIRDDLAPGATPEEAAPPGPVAARSQEGPGGAFGVLPEGAEPVSRPRPEADPGPADARVITIPVARTRSDSLDARVALPAGVWRRLLTARGDTMVVVTAPGDSTSYLLVPILGFPQRTVAIAGWRFDPAKLSHRELEAIVEREVYRDRRVFRGDVMQKSLALLLFDGRGREVFRSRPVGREEPKVEHAIGALLPGWRVVAAPSQENAFTTIQRFIVGEYVLVVALLALSLFALALAMRLAVQQVEVAELKSSFLANVTHELKTPLAMIRMASETLELGRVRNEAESRRFLATIGRECRRLTHMINNVLDFAKIEEGRREFFFASGDLRKLVGDTLEVFEPQLEQGGFAVKVELPESMPPVEMDTQAITQCLINLVDNAIKYSQDHKEIGIRVSANGVARVEVSDRGIGVPAKDAERIFEKFTRAETGLVHNVKGSGLGLALVRHIARAHGGDVQLQSVPGQGSTFTLELPLKQPERKEENGWPRRS
jgi:signal transduction histidine kinase